MTSEVGWGGAAFGLIRASSPVRASRGPPRGGWGCCARARRWSADAAQGWLLSPGSGVPDGTSGSRPDRSGARLGVLARICRGQARGRVRVRQAALGWRVLLTGVLAFRRSGLWGGGFPPARRTPMGCMRSSCFCLGVAGLSQQAWSGMTSRSRGSCLRRLISRRGECEREDRRPCYRTAITV